ncbi:MAG: pilus assembly protein CpaE, partial [Alphaproteobacteria bacterium]|nr:pilus assembly protein CpaE [Alphaproteobacteria bacterium]
MRNNRSNAASNRTNVLVLTADADFEQLVRATFTAAAQIDLSVLTGTLAANEEDITGEDATVIVIDLDTRRDEDLAALTRLMARLNGWPPVVVVTASFDRETARQLLQMRVADFLVKPVPPVELVRTCARVVQAPPVSEASEANIFTYLPAVGGAGVTTLAIQTALLLLNSGGQKARPATCLVDLNFQHGTCADYLDLEPRLDLKEIEPRPERLDRQLLEVMTAYHASGLAVIAAPNRPAEMRTFDPDIVTRLLDLVSSHFNYVVIDMPRTWFSWTDSVLLGSNRLFIVSEMTVPGLKHAKQLVAAISERLGEDRRPQVIVNRF